MSEVRPQNCLWGNSDPVGRPGLDALALGIRRFFQMRQLRAHNGA